MQTTYRGLCAIAREEAVVLVPYPDGRPGEFSIGIGHYDPTLKADSPAITIEEAWELFRSDMAPRELEVAKMLKMSVVPQENDALVSAYYNKGSKVRPVIDLINKGEKMEAMALLLTINRNAQGEFKAGLASRREREMRMFLRGDYSDEEKDVPKLKLWRGAPIGAPELIDFPVPTP